LGCRRGGVKGITTDTQNIPGSDKVSRGKLESMVSPRETRSWRGENGVKMPLGLPRLPTPSRKGKEH